MKWVVRGQAGEREIDVDLKRDGTLSVQGPCAGTVDLVPLDGSFYSLRWVHDHRAYELVAQREGPSRWRVRLGEREFAFDVLSPVEAAQAQAAGTRTRGGRLEAPIPGRVVAVRVRPGDRVEAGDTLVILEAMKMENELTAEAAGEVEAVHVAPGDTVEAGAVLVELAG